MNRVLLVLWLTLVWVLLWGSVTVGNVVAGLVLGTVLVVVVRQGEQRASGLHPIAVLHYGVVFAWALVVATAGVASAVLRPRLALEQGIVGVPLRARSPVVVAFIANSLTLTPGTLTVDIRPRDYGVDEDSSQEAGTPGAAPVLYVHCLVTGDPDDVRADVRRWERLAVAAFGSEADRAAMEGPPPPWPPAVVPGGAPGAAPGDASGTAPGDASVDAAGAAPGDASAAAPRDASGAAPGDASAVHDEEQEDRR